MEDEIDLRDIFRVLWKRRLLIIGVFAIAVLAAGAISFAMSPVYSVSSIVAAGNFNDATYTSQASIINVMQSDEFLLDVFQEINPNGSATDFGVFKNSVAVKPIKDNDKLVEISVETNEKQEGLMAVERIIQIYANRSNESYNEQQKILSGQLENAQMLLDATNMEINQTRDSLNALQGASGSSEVQAEMRFSRMLDLLNIKETRRSALMDRVMDLNKQMTLMKNLQVIQPPREPVSPIGPRRALIVAIAGMFGLIAGVFAAFLREALGKPIK